jgi:hypothetical protein
MISSRDLANEQPIRQTAADQRIIASADARSVFAADGARG